MAQPTSAQRASGVAASSSSFAPFDVFINHRGPDVKNTLASLLYHELKSRGLQVFLDRPELEPGHIIITQIKAAIEGASVHVAIFSPKYAESKWCLDELVHMIDSTGKILPVFYKVKPSELRWTDKGAYADALRKHEEQQRYDLRTIVEWKKALSHVADISGFELDACNGDEVELVDMVVQRVLKEVPKPPLHVAKYQIGLQEKLEDFERKVLSQLEEEGRPEAKVVGIVGLGGIGKSTLARIFFNRERSNYLYSSFLADVRENEARKSITSLQSQLIKDLRGRDISIRSREEGIGKLEKNLKSCHSLVILDDVDHLDQLDALILPIRYVLDPKSLILITSRDKHVLRSARITDSSIYQLKGLDTPHSLELFCCHAFFQPHPLPQFEDLVDGFVKACHGLPLSLQVFGALLCEENDTSYWEEQLNELQTLPPEIEVRLKISYDSLNKQEKQIFLDIACFSIGHDKDKWIRIWGGSRWKGSAGLRNLENKCLIEVDAKNKIRMHDHLRDMGRNIAAEDRSMPCRIWGVATVKEVYDLLEQSLSSNQKIEVRGIIMPRQRDRFTNAWKEGSFSDEVFRRISKLELLVAAEDFVEGILSKVRSPNLNLLWLDYIGCTSSSLPSCIPMGDLRVLEVSGDYMERLWQRESQPPLQLRELNIHDIQFSEFPNSLSQLQHLEKIALGYLWGQQQLSALPEELCHLPSLQYLKLEHCTKLQTLPHSLANLTNVKSIDLTCCYNLEVLPNELGTLTNLREINLAECKKLKMLPDSIENLRSIQKINLAGCKKLKILPDFSENLLNIQEINLAGCESLEVLPNAIGSFTNLREINLAGCKKLKMLPDFSENLLNIQEINLAGCESLEVLPDSIANLSSLQKINLARCKKFKMLSDFAENLLNIQEINLAGCESLEVLPDSIANLRSLQKINLAGCKKLKMLPDFWENLLNIQEINLAGCESLEVLPDSIANLRSLQKINLAECKNLKMLPDSIENLRSLQKINLYGCESLEVLPNAFENFTNLREISLAGWKKMNMLPNFMEKLKNITEINLAGCESLEVLPYSIGNLTNLQMINLMDCTSLKVLPNTFGNLTNLREINLAGCGSLEVLPNSIENLTNLHTVNLESCKSLKVLPNGIWNSRNLQEINLALCKSLEMLPNFSENLTNIQRIGLSGCKSLEVLPNSIENLINLRAISLEGCECLEVLPNSFGNLTNLEYIDASQSFNLQSPSDLLGNLLQLKHLHLSCCSSLTISNETLGNITTLECLDLSGCLQMEVLPLQVLHQRFLKSLNLSSTNIKELPSVPTVCLSNLEELILGSPLLKVLPPWLGCLKSLRKLLLHGCRKLKCLPDSVGQLSQMRVLEISKCGIQYLPADVMQLNNLKILRVRGCPLRELPFKMVEGDGEPSLVTESSEGRRLDSSIHTGLMDRLKEIDLYLTDILEVSFPEGVCANLEKLKITWCNDLVEVGALPTTLVSLDLRGCGALRKIGLAGLSKLEELDMRGCCAVEVEELPGLGSRTFLRSLRILRIPFQTYYTGEVHKDVQAMAALQEGVLEQRSFCY